MRPTPRRTRPLAASITLAATIALTLAACGGDDDDGAAGETTGPAVSSADSTTPPSTAAAAITTTPATEATTATTTAATTAGTDGAATSAPPDTTAAAATTAATSPPSSTPGAATTEPASATPATYEVAEGDTLFDIALGPVVGGDVIQIPSPGDASDEAVSASELLELELTDGVSTAVADPLADGVYYTIRGEPNADGSAIEMELMQFETTEACEARIAASTVPDDTASTDECTGYHVVETPSATIELPVDSEVPVVVLLAAPPEVTDLLAYEVTPDVWLQLLQGGGPDWSSEWLDGGAFVQVTDGAVTRVEVSVIGS